MPELISRAEGAPLPLEGEWTGFETHLEDATILSFPELPAHSGSAHHLELHHEH